MSSTTNTVPVKISENTFIYVQVEKGSGPVNVSSSGKKFFSIEGVKESIEEFSTYVKSAFTEICPDKASVEFGFEFTVKEGKLVAALVSGESKSSLKIKLEWDKK